MPPTCCVAPVDPAFVPPITPYEQSTEDPAAGAAIVPPFATNTRPMELWMTDIANVK